MQKTSAVCAQPRTCATFTQACCAEAAANVAECLLLELCALLEAGLQTTTPKVWLQLT
jgi:hypothetical protein